MSQEQLLAVPNAARALICDDCLYGPAGYATRQGVRAAGRAFWPHADRSCVAMECAPDAVATRPLTRLRRRASALKWLHRLRVSRG